MLNNLFLKAADKILTEPKHKSKLTQMLIDKSTVIANNGCKTVDMKVFTAEKMKVNCAMTAGTILLSLIGSKIAADLANKNS